ncbi:MAG TPA: hypothetical protein VI643_02365 [Planctomycetota bacterium]|nr:hypothetical protein [Planctomycetota bacterium]
MEPANEADAQFLQAAQRIGVIGVRQVEHIVELTRQTGKSALEIAEEYQLMTAGQVARVSRSLGEAAPAATRRAFSPAPTASSGINLGPIVGIVVIAALGFLAWNLFSGSSKPKKSGGRPPPSTSAVPSSRTQIEQRDTEARKLLADADAALAAGTFDTAIALYERLEREFPDTETFALSAEKVWDAQERCHVQLGRGETLPASRREENRRTLEKWSRVKALANEGRWPEAEPLLKELAQEMAPDDLRRAQVEAWIGRLTLDPGVIAAWDRVKKLADSGDWRRVYDEVRAFSAVHSGSGNFEKIAPEVHAMMERAYSEKLAVDQVEAARDARSRGDWNAVLAAVDDLQRSRGATETYAKAKTELQQLAAEAHAKRTGPESAAAQEMYDRARGFEASGKLEEAHLAYEKLISEMAASEWVSQRRGEIEAALARVKKSRGAALEAEAQRRFADIQRMMKAKLWKQALEAMQQLQGQHFATKLWAEKQAEIREMTAECQRELDLILAKLVDDLERGADRWVASTGGVSTAISKKGDAGGDAFEGTSSVALEFGSHTRGARSAWPRATCRLNRMVPEKSARLAFYARAEGGGASLIVDFAMRLGLEEAILTSPPVSIGASWSRVTIPLSNFKFEWLAVDRGEHKGAKITLRTELLQVLGFTSNSPDRRIKVWIDDVKFE